MPRTHVVFFQDDEGVVPVLEWFDHLPEKALDKCRVKLERLRELGHELRRPEADYLRDGIHELRVRVGSVNYRMLYFFHDKVAAVVSHGLAKEKRVPPGDIDRAVTAKEQFARDPGRHTYREG
ncbi:type II toxin-antitoxin system RelE/ParE family toxin [Aquisphaera insulae]|uniref:type II toxin-antitoxin system RelE/ParE family toxin n=1 Tax=Aquisphaera insulae TaxID=2712864 RepID=UPI0013EA1676|nr:type II toxin-antitoxin system RelE/ParE family toxin [Aquisphaera insulae]